MGPTEPLQVEADLTLGRRGKGLHMVDFIYQHLDDRGGLAVTLLQLLNARGQVLVGGYHLTQADERLDNGDAHLNRTRAVENRRQHAPRRAP